MARLPGDDGWLIQQNDGVVSLFNEQTGEVGVSFDPSDENAAAKAQFSIHTSALSPEDKCFAHFWSGYFYAHATR